MVERAEPGAEDAAPAAPATTRAADRVLGVVEGERAGPLVLLVGGMHGNEPSGVTAVREVLGALRPADVLGRVVGILGNVSATADGVRHHERDLNRIWTDAHLARLAEQDPADDDATDRELRGLSTVVLRELADAAGRPVVLVDLHSTSCEGGPFTVLADSVPSRKLARALPLPAVLGLEERIDGPLLTWLVDRGHAGIVVEGGQHEDPDTVRVSVAAVWTALWHLRVVDRHRPEVVASLEVLAAASRGLPPVVDLVYAHPVAPDDGYVMEPGWRNFMRVRRHQSVALQEGRVVQAPLDGYMLMPLYQGLGSEGYFLCRPVSKLWLLASRAIRRARADGVLRLLKEVRGVDPRAGRLVSTRDVRGWVVEVLHLFGYRKHVPRGHGEMLWLRRPQRRRS